MNNFKIGLNFKSIFRVAIFIICHKNKTLIKSEKNGVITVLLKDGSEINVNKKDASYVKLDDFDINDFNKEI